MLSPLAYDRLNSKLAESRDALEKTQTQLGKTGQSAAQTANAMRMIPAQMTDIVVGLSTGQSPFMVLMQQGGQLKDMFGGIGPAIKGVGGYVSGLINPFTLAAAAVGVLGLAYYKGSQEQDEFYKSLTMTGNLVGKTSVNWPIWRLAYRWQPIQLPALPHQRLTSLFRPEKWLVMLSNA
jgi:phage-related minor tail protein